MRGKHELERAGRDAARRPADFEALCAAFASLRTPAEAARFLYDLATPAEREAFSERWRIARMIDEEAWSYRDIAAATGSSTATVVRVARFLRDEPHEGYRLVLDRNRRAGRNSSRKSGKTNGFASPSRNPAGCRTAASTC